MTDLRLYFDLWNILLISANKHENSIHSDYFVLIIELEFLKAFDDFARINKKKQFNENRW